MDKGEMRRLIDAKRQQLSPGGDALLQFKAFLGEKYQSKGIVVAIKESRLTVSVPGSSLGAAMQLNKPELENQAKLLFRNQQLKLRILIV